MFPDEAPDLIAPRKTHAFGPGFALGRGAGVLNEFKMIVFLNVMGVRPPARDWRE
jgi:hypothetical protein